MQYLVSPFIIDHYNAGGSSGDLVGASLFVDIAGYSTITRTLMSQGQHGAEVLAGIMRAVFDPLVTAVYAHGGFVTLFAGDAFTALVPVALQNETGTKKEKALALAARRALAAGWAIRAAVIDHSRYETEYGTFTISVKVGLAVGDCHWEIVRAPEGKRATFYFRGTAVDGAARAEKQAGQNMLMLTSTAQAILAAEATTVADGDYWRVLAVADSLPESGPITLPAAENAALSPFFPPEVMTYNSDFRQIINLFISLQSDLSDAQMVSFGQTLLALQDRYGGLLNRIDFGDKGPTALLFWGAPVSHENDMERAFNFMLDLRDQSSIALRAGLTRQVAHAGVIGSTLQGEFTCYGDGINLAVRLMTSAPWGSIWLDEGLAQRGRRRYRIRDAGQQTFKGFAEPRMVYTLEGRRTQQLADFYSTPLVGRKEELLRLREFVRPLWGNSGHEITAGENLGERLPAPGFAGILVIEGDAGLGKSRLVTDFWLRLEAELQGADSDLAQMPQLFTGQTDQLVRTGLNPFRYWLRDYFSQSPSQSEERNKRAFDRRLDALITATKDKDLCTTLTRGRSFLGALIDLSWPGSPYVQLEPEGRREWTFSALKALILAECRRRPVIFLLEDGHWFDEESTAFLQRLIRGIDNYPLAILITTRSVIGTNRLLDEMAYQRLLLTTLSPGTVAELAAGILSGPIDPALTALLTTRAEGNPFFAEQLLLYLQEAGALVKKDGTWQMAGGKSAVQLPADVRVIFTARLDRLTQSVKEVVQTAAVLGREFEVGVLARMLRDERLEDKLDAASQEAIWSALSQLRYIFKHSLLRDAAYRMQLRVRRSELHQLAAATLTYLHPEPSAAEAGEIAYHYETAFQLGLATVRDEAVVALQRAGELAGQRYEHHEAASYFSRALAILPETADEQRYVLLLRREVARDRLGDREGQAADLAALAGLSQTQPARQLEVTLRRARLAEATGDYPAAIELAETAVPQAQATGQVEQEAVAHERCGHALHLQGDFAAAEVHYDLARSLAEAVGERQVMAHALNGLGMVVEERGKYDLAQDHYQQSLAIFEEIGSRSGLATSLNLLGSLAYRRGAFEKARVYYERALAIQEEIGDRRGTALGWHTLGKVDGSQGAYESARQYYEQALAIRMEIGDRHGMAATLGNLGVDAGELGAFEAARDYLEQSLAIQEEISRRPGMAICLLNLGHVAYSQAAYEAALDYYKQSLAISEAIQYRRDMVGHALTGVAAAQVGLGQLAPALAAGERALALRQELGQEQLLMETMAILAEIELRQGQPAAALARIEPIVTHLAQGGDLTGTEYDLRNWLIAYWVLEANDDDRAHSVIKAAYETLKNRAVRLEQDPSRHAFLNAVPLHREIADAFKGKKSQPEVSWQKTTGLPEHDRPKEVLTPDAETESDTTDKRTVGINTGQKKRKLKKKKKRKKKSKKQPSPIVIHIHNYYGDQVFHMETISLETLRKLLAKIEESDLKSGDEED